MEKKITIQKKLDKLEKTLRKHSLVFTGKDGKTKSEYTKSSNINTIMANASKGIMPQFNQNINYADVSNIEDYADSLIKVKKAEQAFKALDPKIRNRFQGNPEEMLKFLQNPNNKEEAQKLGLLETEPDWMKSNKVPTPPPEGNKTDEKEE